MNTGHTYNFQVNHTVEYTEEFFVNNILNNFSNFDENRIFNSYLLAKEYHGPQLRSDGSPYIIHPLRIAVMISKYDLPIAETLIGAFLHDTLEDTALEEKDISNAFGTAVLSIVKSVTRRKNYSHQLQASRKESKTNKWREIMSAPREARVIKTFDYLDNMISWKFIEKDNAAIKKIPRWLMEAQAMYIPLSKITNTTAYELMNEEFQFYLNLGYSVGTWYSDQ